MASDATGLGIVDFHCSFGPDHVSLNIEEVDIMRTDVDNGEDQERVSALAVKPLRLV